MLNGKAAIHLAASKGMKTFVELLILHPAIDLYLKTANGKTARDYTYIKDTVRGILQALDYCMNNQKVYLTLNLGNNNPIKLIELVNIIYQGMGKEKNIYFEPMQPGDVDITFADIQKAKKIIGYEPLIDIKTGIKFFLAWFNSQNS